MKTPKENSNNHSNKIQRYYTVGEDAKEIYIESIWFAYTYILRKMRFKNATWFCYEDRKTKSWNAILENKKRSILELRNNSMRHILLYL